MTFYDYCKEKDKESFLLFWSTKNKIAPKDITPSSRKNIVFECPVCGWQTEKVIHDIRNNKGIVCKECEAKKKALQQKSKQQEKENNKRMNKKEIEKSIIKDYIAISDISKHKEDECHFVAEIINKKLFYKKDKSLNSIKYFCKDKVSYFEIDFLIKTKDKCFNNFPIHTLIDVKAIKEQSYFSYELKVVDISTISKEQYDEIQQIFINKEIKRKENREKSKIKREQDKKIKEKKQQEIAILPLEQRYLMIDIETNGLNSKNDDILEIAIYKPDENKFFHKYLPLTKQKEVLTTEFNGITTETLNGATHINEEEMQILIDEFEITKRILLHYGTLDAPFMREYFKFIKLPNRTKIQFYNFKKNIYSSKWSGGDITKDNLCKMLCIEGVQDVHNAKNDCLLQWELFKAMDEKPWLITSAWNDYDVYKYNSDYYMPASYIQSYGRIHQLTGCKLPKMKLEKIRDVISIDLPKELNKYSPWLIDYFIGNIMEQQINVGLDAKDLSMESFIWCAKNKSCLEKVGSFSVKPDTPIIEYAFKKDGKIETLGDKERKEEVGFLTVIARRIKNYIEEEGFSCEITNQGIYMVFAGQKELVFDLSVFPNISIEIEIRDDAECIVVYGNNNLLVENITNEFIEMVQPYTKKFADEIKSVIFRDKQIYSQENVVSDKYHTLALCDFSNEYAIVEMKVSCSPWLTSNYASQCFLQAIGVPATNNFIPILKDFKDVDLPIEKRREMYLCIYDNKQNKLMVSEYRFCKKV